MKIVQKNGKNSGAFYAENDGEIIAEMTYIWDGKDTFVINHTAVSSMYRDEGIGNRLVESAVEYARDNSLYIIPVCSFARSVFEKNDKYNDVRKKLN